jgi:acetyl-CoA carboxylase biotin carboxyl carrier protein
MDVKRIENIFDLIKDTDIRELSWEKEGVKLRLRRNTQAIPVKKNKDKNSKKVLEVSKAVPAQTQVQVEQPVIKKDENTEIINSTMIGIFYLTNPDSGKVFVSVGDTVKKGQKIGVVKTMKIMKEVLSTCDGIIDKILIRDGEKIDYSKELFVVKTGRSNV